MSQIPEKQVNLNPKTQAIAAQTSIGVIQSLGPSTATILPTGAMAGPLLAAVDGAAVRGAIDFDLRARQIANASRGLVFNGNCSLNPVLDSGFVLRAPGFSTWEYDTAYKQAGNYSIKPFIGWRYTDGFIDLTAGVVYGSFLSSRIFGAPPVGAGMILALPCFDGEPTPNPINSHTRLGQLVPLVDLCHLRQLSFISRNLG
jgi:hypothetical protein